MARTRQLKPALFDNEVLGSADPLLTLLFEGLWVNADRAGRLKDIPAWINSHVFPYRGLAATQVDEMLNWLTLGDEPFIVRYQAAGKRYIQITGWEHQKPHQNETASVIPPPSDNGASGGVPNSPSSNSNSESDSLRVAAAAAVGTSDPVQRRIWTDGVELLALSGLSETQARPLLGRLARDHGEDLLAEAIAVTQAKNPADPKAFLIGVLRERSAPKGSSVGRDDPAREWQPDPPCAVCGDELCLRDHRFDAARVATSEGATA